jgi:hypothetical protein
MQEAAGAELACPNKEGWRLCSASLRVVIPAETGIQE